MAGSSERDALVRERDFLLRSIEDLELEHTAGDVSDDDFHVLHEDYVARAAATVRALAADSEEQASPSDRTSVSGWTRARRLFGRRRARRALAAVSIVCLLGVVAIVVGHAAGVRFPGESATGTVSLPKSVQISDDLSEANLLAESGRESEAVDLYGEVLALDARQPEALAYRGWLIRLAGESAHSTKTIAIGDASIARATKVDPKFAAARAYDAIALFEDRGETSAAVVQVQAFLADHPTPALLASVGPSLVLIDEHAHVPVPRALAAFVTTKR